MVKFVSRCFYKPEMTYLHVFSRYIQLNKLTNIQITSQYISELNSFIVVALHLCKWNLKPTNLKKRFQILRKRDSLLSTRGFNVKIIPTHVYRVWS